MKAKIEKSIVFLWIGVVMMSFFAGCSLKKHTVSGDSALFTGLGQYRRGARVEVVLEAWASDTDYAFFVDGQPADVSFEYDRGYIVSFTMPDHDVAVTHTTRNEMVQRQYEGG